jgi:large subunit ribosomal protein L17
MQTTVAKAKEVQPLIERLITKGKDGSLANRRQLLKVLYSEKAVNKVIDDISPRYVERPGGYTRITKLGFRQGDGAPIAQIELI